MTERLLIRQVREILRLKHEQGLPHRAIARACGVGLGTVSEYCRRAQRAGLTWPLHTDLDDAQLEARLFRRVGDIVGVPRPVPDMAWIHQELKRPGVTLQRLHLEYLAQQPAGYRYSQFCRHYHDWARTLAPTMRQIHRAGEKAFVDFSGKRDCRSMRGSESGRSADCPALSLVANGQIKLRRISSHSSYLGAWGPGRV